MTIDIKTNQAIIIVDNIGNNDFDFSKYFSFFTSIQSSVRDAMRIIIVSTFEEIDAEFKNSPFRKSRYYINKSNVSRTLNTIIGPITFKRTYYKSKFSKKSFFFLDYAFDLPKYDHYDPIIKAIAIKNAVETSQAQASRFISSFIDDIKFFIDDNAFLNIPRQSIFNWIKSWYVPNIVPKSINTPETLYVMADEKYIGAQDIDKPIEYMTVDVLKLLLKQPNINTIKGRRDLTLLATLYDTGARVSELINMKVRDIKFDKVTTTVRLFGKGSKIRVVPVIGNTAHLLDSYIKEHHLEEQYDEYLFVSNLKKPLTEPGVKYIIEKYRALAEKESVLVPKNIHPHTFRHSKAMHLLESGVNYIYIRDFLGHSNIKTTEIYAKISVEQKKKALSAVYNENVPVIEETSWNKDTDLLSYLMQL